MTGSAPRFLRDVLLVVAASILALAALLMPAGPALADDTTAAWAVTPCDADGNTTGETRFELEADPGASVTGYVLLTNSSTVERAFDVYGADGFNTPTGGYDLDAAAVTPTDVGSWVTVSASPVDLAALSTAVVEFTVTVPDGATPGDHPGGIVVSPRRGQVTNDGVVVDTRVAVRLNVRVPGEVVAALDVRDVGASYAFTAVPFGSSVTTVHYDVVNTGNVKVVGVPRLRITGPFGVRLAELDAEQTHEVLPGDSFTVTSTVDGVAPVMLATATVDVAMTAAPGPRTELPAVSSTGHATFAVISWTGLAVVVVIGLAAWLLVGYLRRRRREGEELWDRAVDEARADLEAGRAPRTGGLGATGGALAVLALAGGLLIAGAPHALADESDGGAITITVPSAGASPSQGASGPSGASVPSGSRGASRSAAPPGGGTDGAVPDPGGSGTGGGAISHQVPEPDLLWSAPEHWDGNRWLLAGGGLAVVGGLTAWSVRSLVLARRVVA